MLFQVFEFLILLVVLKVIYHFHLIVNLQRRMYNTVLYLFKINKQLYGDGRSHNPYN